MSGEVARSQLLQSIEWICQTLWPRDRREPELLEFQADRGSTGYPHYILSRVGLLPASDWVAALYVMPPSLVEHLTPRCLELDPAGYLLASLEAGGAALHRYHPAAPGGGLVQLAQGSSPEGRLPRAWAGLPLTGDPHRDLLWAAMALREARAYYHYRAAEAQELEPLQLLIVSACWKGRDPSQVQQLFRWSDAEVSAAAAALGARGWLTKAGELTASGRAARDRVEAATNAHTDRLLSFYPERELERLLEELPGPSWS